MCNERYRCSAESRAKSTYKNLSRSCQRCAWPPDATRPFLLLAFHQVNDAAGQHEVVPAHYRNDARHRALILPRTHRYELTAC